MQNDILTTSDATPFAQTPRWICFHNQLTPSAKALYSVLMCYADNKTKVAFPGRNTLAKNLNVSVRTIGRYIIELEKVKALTVTRRRNKKTGNFFSNHYKLHFTPPPEDTRVPPPEDTHVPITITTKLTTTTNNSIVTPSSNDDGKKENHFLNHQTWIKSLPPLSQNTTTIHQVNELLEDKKEKLINSLTTLNYSTGTDYYDQQTLWNKFIEELESLTDLDIANLIINQRFSERLGETVAHYWDKPLKYGITAWFNTLLNTAIKTLANERI